MVRSSGGRWCSDGYSSVEEHKMRSDWESRKGETGGWSGRALLNKKLLCLPCRQHFMYNISCTILYLKWYLNKSSRKHFVEVQQDRMFWYTNTSRFWSKIKQEEFSKCDNV